MTAFESAWLVLKAPLSESDRSLLTDEGTSEGTIRWLDEVLDDSSIEQNDAARTSLSLRQLVNSVPLANIEEGGFLSPTIQTKDGKRAVVFLEDWLSGCVPKQIRGTPDEAAYKLQAFEKLRQSKKPGSAWNEDYAYGDDDVMRFVWSEGR